MRSYDFRFLNSDGSPSLLYNAQCVNDEQAKRTAEDMTPAGCARYEIWLESERVAEAPVSRPAA